LALARRTACHRIGSWRTVDTFRAKYTRQILKEWACLNYKSTPSDTAPAGGCVFLSANGQCGIYETRPLQCRTYPFWPSLLATPEDWEEEAVVPDNEESDDRKRWTLEHGGCEGINHADAPLVPADEIELKRREARAHWRRFLVDASSMTRGIYNQYQTKPKNR
jgi:Fe-S-cluster containining protein